MPLYIFSLSIIFSLFFTACMTTPEIPLSPKLSEYSLVKENCKSVRISLTASDELHQSCDDFLKRLKKTSENDNKMAKFRAKNENAESKPEYLQLKTLAHRQHHKTNLEYQKLSETLNRVSLVAIEDDQLHNVEITLTFPETIFTKQHYDYYKRYGAAYINDPQYLSFEKRHSKELIKQGLVYLSQGDKKRANKAFKEASSLNNAQAEYLVGIVYEAKYIDKAIEWHTKAKEHGIKGSRLNLARLYNRKREPKEAQKLYIEAAEDGDAYAQYLLYEQYKKTDNIKTNAMASEWVKRSAEYGFPPAEYAYGQQLLQEKGSGEAKEWLIKAHEHGISAANATLGTIYFKEEKYKKALQYLSVAQSAKAKYQLAKMYERGLGVETNFYKSYMLYKEALKLGQKNAKKDVARLTKLKTKKEQAHYDAAKRKKRQQQKALTLRYGEEPIHRNIRTNGMSIRLKGLVTLPLQNNLGFIVHSEDGRQFYVIDFKHDADVSQYQYVDITTKATSYAVTVSNDKGLTSDIYQFMFQKHCQ